MNGLSNRRNITAAANWRSQLNSKQVGASLISWQVRGLPIVMAGDHQRAGRLVASMLRQAAIHRWRELRQFCNAIDSDSSLCARCHEQ
jgi:hypothetical protein